MKTLIKTTILSCAHNSSYCNITKAEQKLIGVSSILNSITNNKQASSVVRTLLMLISDSLGSTQLPVQC